MGLYETWYHAVKQLKKRNFTPWVALLGKAGVSTNIRFCRPYTPCYQFEILRCGKPRSRSPDGTEYAFPYTAGMHKNTKLCYQSPLARFIKLEI